MKAIKNIKYVLMPIYLYSIAVLYKFTLNTYSVAKLVNELNVIDNYYLYRQALSFGVGFAILFVVFGINNKIISAVLLFILSVAAIVADTGFCIYFIVPLTSCWVIKNLFDDNYSFKSDILFEIPLIILQCICFIINYIIFKNNLYRVVEISPSVKKHLIISTLCSIAYAVIVTVFLLIADNKIKKPVIDKIMFYITQLLLAVFCIINFLKTNEIFMVLYKNEDVDFNNKSLFIVFYMIPVIYLIVKIKNKSCINE